MYNQRNEILPNEDCFYIEDRYIDKFDVPIRRYFDYELNLVVNAPGANRIVGCSVEAIGDYDLVLITNRDLEYNLEQYNNNRHIRRISIQFSPDIFGNLLCRNAFSPIPKMFDKACKGLCFPMNAILKTYHQIDSLTKKEKDFYFVINLFAVLYDLSSFVGETQELSSSVNLSKIDNIHLRNSRIQKIQEYLRIYYKDNIRLEYLASLVKMTPVSLSRFYKQKTGINISDYLIDIRLTHASHLLKESELPIHIICRDAGFNNISNFNRIFKRRINLSPKAFRMKFQE
ncbi:AraC family transcriptional regulator [Dysgonomonas sp. 25]|uniref:AraC family transcriptional regulator n=1 Tax=Dysgonomonas sp. 25 TaxID=2302933 RepID=UPI0013D41B3A|nr:AraC family transcriptional regulator [Dysgonomonas sp. 25]NDV68142.1 AraC family transcriptional regulator [Dysgonomonas sp. 25]